MNNNFKPPHINDTAVPVLRQLHQYEAIAQRAALAWGTPNAWQMASLVTGQPEPQLRNQWAAKGVN